MGKKLYQAPTVRARRTICTYQTHLLAAQTVSCCALQVLSLRAEALFASIIIREPCMMIYISAYFLGLNSRLQLCHTWWLSNTNGPEPLPNAMSISTSSQGPRDLGYQGFGSTDTWRDFLNWSVVFASASYETVEAFRQVFGSGIVECVGLW